MINSHELLPKSYWRGKLLFFWSGLAILLFLSLVSAPISNWWQVVDTQFALWINRHIADSLSYRFFAAVMSHSLADWVEDLCILAFYVLAVIRAPKEMRYKRSSQLIFCVFLMASTILLANRLVCRDLFKLRRESPSLAMDSLIQIRNYITAIEFKVDSSKSFPGDHATTALLFASSYAYFVRGKLGACALIYGVILCLPRLIVGAHWLSDILVGSGVIVLISLSWAFCSPLSHRCIQGIENGLRSISKSSKKVKNELG